MAKPAGRCHSQYCSSVSSHASKIDSVSTPLVGLLEAPLKRISIKSEESQSEGVAGVVGLVIHRTFPFEGQGCGPHVTKSDLFLTFVMSIKRN